jgi:transcriptional regulator with XRE-family HTH domain
MTKSENGKIRHLHRLRQVRCREGVSRRKVARALGIRLADVRHQEDSATDISLSLLYAWQRVLDVPAAELLEEPTTAISPPLRWRAGLVLAMKSARAISERAREPMVRRLADNLVRQLAELMPELREVRPWQEVGKRRRSSELGRAADGLSVDLHHLEDR